MEIPEIVNEYSYGGEGDFEEIIKALKPFEGVMADLNRAARFTKCGWIYSDPLTLISAESIDFGGVIRGMRLTTSRARLRSEQGNVDGALRDLLTVYKVGSDCLANRSDKGPLVGVIGLAMADNVFRFNLAERTFSADQLALLLRHIVELRRRYPPFRTWKENERETCLATIDEIALHGLTRVMNRMLALSGSAPPPRSEVQKKLFQRVDATLMADGEMTRRVLRKRLQEHWELVQKEVDEPLTSSKRYVIKEEIQREATTNFALPSLGIPVPAQVALKGAAAMVVALVSPAIQKPKERHAIGQIALDTLILWCQVQEYALARGNLPASLEEVGPVPMDPFDGKPIKYLRDDLTDGQYFLLGTIGVQGEGLDQMRLFAWIHQFNWNAYFDKDYDSADAAECMKWGRYRSSAGN